MPFFYPDLPYIHETDSWFNSPDEKNTTESSSTSVTCKTKNNKRVCVSSESDPQVPWAECEDRLLCELVAKHGEKKWKMIAEYIPGRTGKQVPPLSLLSPSVASVGFTIWLQVSPKLAGRARRTLFFSLSTIFSATDGPKFAAIFRAVPRTTSRTVSTALSIVVANALLRPPFLLRPPRPPTGRFPPRDPFFCRFFRPIFSLQDLQDSPNSPMILQSCLFPPSLNRILFPPRFREFVIPRMMSNPRG